MRRNFWLWLAAAVLALTVVGYNLFGYYSYAGYWRQGFYGPMGGMMYWMHGPGGLGGGGFGLWNPLWTLLIIGLVVLVVYLLLGSRNDTGRGRREALCANCGRPVEPGWQVCPYCRQPLTGSSPAGTPPANTPPASTPPAGGARPEERGENR